LSTSASNGLQSPEINIHERRLEKQALVNRATSRAFAVDVASNLQRLALETATQVLIAQALIGGLGEDHSGTFAFPLDGLGEKADLISVYENDFADIRAHLSQ
jgi:hypothetical protein